MSTWQPIETAPKDDTPFLVYWPKDINGNPQIEMVGGWREYAEIVSFGEPAATHWAPLPEPPEAA